MALYYIEECLVMWKYIITENPSEKKNCLTCENRKGEKKMCKLNLNFKMKNMNSLKTHMWKGMDHVINSCEKKPSL